MTKTTDKDPEMKLAQTLAMEGTTESLAQLATLSSTVRNSAETYHHLGNVSAADAEPVISYILSQARTEDNQLLYALKALVSIHTPSAENTIVTIAKNILGTGKKFADCIGAEAIVALQDIGSETAADRILELAYGDDNLVFQALTSLGALYDGDQNRFIPAYKQMLGFSMQPAILDRTVTPAVGKPDEKLLRQAFIDADKRRLLPELESVEGREQPSVGFATCAFDLAVAEARMTRELMDLQQTRQDMSVRLFTTRDR